MATHDNTSSCLRFAEATRPVTVDLLKGTQKNKSEKGPRMDSGRDGLWVDQSLNLSLSACLSIQSNRTSSYCTFTSYFIVLHHIIYFTFSYRAFPYLIVLSPSLSTVILSYRNHIIAYHNPSRVYLLHCHFAHFSTYNNDKSQLACPNVTPQPWSCDPPRSPVNIFGASTIEATSGPKAGLMNTHDHSGRARSNPSKGNKCIYIYIIYIHSYIYMWMNEEKNENTKGISVEPRNSGALELFLERKKPTTTTLEPAPEPATKSGRAWSWEHTYAYHWWHHYPSFATSNAHSKSSIFLDSFNKGKARCGQRADGMGEASAGN